jgi:hypothetical protein
MAASRSSVAGWLRALEPILAQPIPPWVLRAMIIVGPIIMLRRWPLSLLALWGLAIWFVPRLYRELLGSRALHHEAGARLAAAQAALVQEAEQKSSLERELQKVTKALQQAEGELRKERQKPRPDSGPPNPIFRRVGLDADCPRWVAEGVRREYRKRLHPDTKPAGQKLEAERRFKEVETVFGEIWRLRNFSA